MSEREPDGWHVCFGNYFPREVIATFRTEAEAKAYMYRDDADDMEEIEPFYFQTLISTALPSWELGECSEGSAVDTTEER